MFSENLRAIRKSKGFTQEELALKVNVVRQTVSKWEKGLSVPDAITLQKIAAVLDVSVSEILGAEIEEDNNRNEIANQLSRINEQLAIKNRRWNVFWKIVIGIILGVILLNIIGVFLFSVNKMEKVETINVKEMIIEKE